MNKICMCTLTLAALLFVLPLVSCAGRETLTVASVDYPALGRLQAVPADELTAEKVSHMSTQNHLRGDDARYYVCLTSPANLGTVRLLVHNDRDVAGTHRLGNLMGSRYGVIDCAYPDAERLLSGNCVGLFNPGLGGYFDDCYAVLGGTDGAEDTAPTEVWHILDEWDEQADAYVYRFEKVADLPDGTALASVMTDFGMLYVITKNHLYTVDLFDGSYTTVELPAHWLYLGFNSMVLLDGSLYIGSSYGIMAYDMEGEMWRWYGIENS